MAWFEETIGRSVEVEKKYGSLDDMVSRIQESKEEYEKTYLTMSFMDKLRVLVRLQKKAYALGQLKVKPWPIDIHQV